MLKISTLPYNNATNIFLTKQYLLRYPHRQNIKMILSGIFLVYSLQIGVVACLTSFTYLVKYKRSDWRLLNGDIFILISLFLTSSLLQMLSEYSKIYYFYHTSQEKILVILGHSALILGISLKLVQYSFDNSEVAKIVNVMLTLYTMGQIIAINTIPSIPTSKDIALFTIMDTSILSSSVTDFSLLSIDIICSIMSGLLLVTFLKEINKCKDAILKDAKKWINIYSSILLSSMLTTYFLSHGYLSLCRCYDPVFDGEGYFLLENLFISVTLIAFECKELQAKVLSDGEMLSCVETSKEHVRYITHEVRSPLSTVSLGLNCLKEIIKTYEDETQQTISSKESMQRMSSETLDLIEDCKFLVLSAIQILNDILLNDKLERNKLTLDICPVFCRELLYDCIRPYRRQLNLEKIHFEMNLPLGFDRVVFNGDRNKMEQVIRNFIVNAIKFTPHQDAGEIMITASFSGNSASDTFCATSGTDSGSITGVLTVMVEDNGVGISDSHIKELFNQYVQIDASQIQAGEGSGLGLWLSKCIIELHGGKVGVSSRGKGKGSTFYFEIPAEIQKLPRKVPQAADQEETSSEEIINEMNGGNSATIKIRYSKNNGKEETQEKPTPSQAEIITRVGKLAPTLHVLIVDDSRVARKLVAKLLETIHSTTLQASNGTEAINLVKESMNLNSQRFDVILIDYVMPGMEGPEVVRKLKEIGYDGKIIALTAAVSSKEVLAMTEAGADDVLSKPFDLQHFLDIAIQNFGQEIICQNSSDGSLFNCATNKPINHQDAWLNYGLVPSTEKRRRGLIEVLPSPEKCDYELAVNKSVCDNNSNYADAEAIIPGGNYNADSEMNLLKEDQLAFP